MIKSSVLALPFVLIWFSECAMAEEHMLKPDFQIVSMKCDLECHNNGVCRFPTRDPHHVQKKMQSGHMIQECMCPMGYRGMSCDTNEDDFPEQCTMAMQGEGSASSIQDCDCAAADNVSTFAGEQCRKPFTEYCASLQNSVGGHISFCTNGGKCMGDMIAAERSPWNTKNNYLFQHAGCICPPEFEGEHCELLNTDYHPVLNKDVLLHETHPEQESNNTDAKKLFLMIFCIGSLAVLGLILIRKVRRNRSFHHDPSLRSTLPRPPSDLALNSLYYSDHHHDDEEGINYQYREDTYGSDSDRGSDTSSEGGEFRDLVGKPGDTTNDGPRILPTLT